LLYSDILHKGQLDDLLKLNPVFETTLPSLFGLPTISNNFAEGYVLKPIENLFLPCGSRVILKHKNDAFKENGEPVNTKAKSVYVPNAFDLQKKIFISYINSNRLASVKSKLTEQECENKDFVIEKLIEDVIEDMKKDMEDTEEIQADKLIDIGKKICNSKKLY